jgi:peptidoglycan biosynthesis protein MviN/MurJ (putative lipid II flippase)
MRLGFLLLSLVGAGQALLIVFLADAGAQTDAFLGSYAIYAPIAALGVSLRITAVPIFAASHDRALGDLHTGLWKAAVAVAALISLGALLLPAAGDAGTARALLLILAPAAGLQVLAGGMAALVNSRRHFTASMAVYVASAFTGLGLSAALLPRIGVTGAALALLCSAILLASLQTLLAVSAIKTEEWSDISGYTGRRETITRIGAGAALPLSQQLGLVLALRFVDESPGAATTYSYAFYIVGLLLNVCVLPLALMSLPDLVDNIRRKGAQAVDEHLLAVVPALLIVLLPLVVTFLGFGEPAVRSLLGGALGDSATADLWSAAEALVPFTIAGGIVALCNVAFLAQGRQRAAVAIAVAAAVMYLVAFAAPLGDGSPQSIAWRHSAVTCFIAVLCWVWLVRQRLWALLPRLVARYAVGAMVLFATVILPAVLVDPVAPVVNLLVAVACLTLYGAVLIVCGRMLRRRDHGSPSTVGSEGETG